MIFRWSIAALIFWFSALAGFSRESRAGLAVADYVAELDRLCAAVEDSPRDSQSIQKIILSLPGQWTVRTQEETYRVNNEWLRGSLNELRMTRSDASRRRLLARIAAMKADAQAFQQPPQDVSSFKHALEGILARHEFRKVHGPTSWDALKRKLLLFFITILQRILGSSAFPAISRVLVWILVAMAVTVLAAWILKTMRRDARLQTIALESSPVSARPWTAWMADANAAAANRRWRDAIHLSYWAGISFLESRGLWRPDRARTPREHLRLLTASSEYRNSLSALTRQFEVVWYGGAEAGPDSFSEALKHLESLGCHSN
jgi:hypothetical protein